MSAFSLSVEIARASDSGTSFLHPEIRTKRSKIIPLICFKQIPSFYIPDLYRSRMGNEYLNHFEKNYH